MARRKVKNNYNLLDTFTFFTPGVRGCLWIFLWFLVGALVGNLISALALAVMNGMEGAMTYATLIAYPFMFIPPMIYASMKSRMNSYFGVGYKMSNDHYAPLGGLFCALLVSVATLATTFLSDSITQLMPPMPEWLEDVLGNLTGGNVIIDLICVSILAPFFEEWLCRGEILRGLLNFEHKNKDGETVRGIKPVWAIVISSVFFAVIHANPWQAIPAFLLGCLFGYVYYKTGSIKLTMLMHCVNNTFAVILSQSGALEGFDDWAEVLPTPLYVALILLSAAIVLYAVFKLKLITPQSEQGNCDRIEA